MNLRSFLFKFYVKIFRSRPPWRNLARRWETKFSPRSYSFPQTCRASSVGNQISARNKVNRGNGTSHDDKNSELAFRDVWCFSFTVIFDYIKFCLSSWRIIYAGSFFLCSLYNFSSSSKIFGSRSETNGRKKARKSQTFPFAVLPKGWCVVSRLSFCAHRQHASRLNFIRI